MSKAVRVPNVSYEEFLSSDSVRRSTGKASGELRQFLSRHWLVLYEHVGKIRVLLLN